MLSCLIDQNDRRRCVTGPSEKGAGGRGSLARLRGEVGDRGQEVSSLPLDALGPNSSSRKLFLMDETPLRCGRELSRPGGKRASVQTDSGVLRVPRHPNATPGTSSPCTRGRGRRAVSGGLRPLVSPAPAQPVPGTQRHPHSPERSSRPRPSDIPSAFLPQFPSCTRNALSTRPFPRGLSPPSALRAALGFDTTSPTPAPLSWHRHEGLPGRHCHLQDPADEQEGSIPLC